MPAVVTSRTSTTSSKAQVHMHIQSIQISDVMSVYSGKAGKCCCGCAGKHSYATAHQAAASKDRGYSVGDDELNDRMVTKVLRLIQAHESELQPYEAGDNHVAVVVGKRLYVAYFTKAFMAKAVA